MRAHYKNTYEVSRATKGMMLPAAIHYLNEVLEHKDIIPFRKYTGGPSHHAQAKKYKHYNGRWPTKSVNHVLHLLKNLKSNAETNGLDVEKCQITHVLAQRAVQGRRRTYRAHGRISKYLSSNCHVEFHVTEKAGPVAREDKQQVRLTKKQAAQQRLAIGK